MSVGKNIKTLRESRGWTLRELGKRSDVSYSVINKIELERCRHHDIHQMNRLADAFNVPVNQMVDGEVK